MKILLSLALMLIVSISYSQKLKGTVYEFNIKGEKQTLPGANLYWLNTTKGTVSDAKGKFKLDRNKSNILIVSFVGYMTDTIEIGNKQKYIEIEMRFGQQLDEINIVQRKRTSYMSTTKPIVTEIVTGEELCKAACCNLGESFNTNASVDVAYADAVTGAKQIQMLGLTGQYIQMMTENMANFRGIASKFGLSYIPGGWMDAISISKGTGSVTSGYESIAGQISVDYKKPEKSEKIFVNGYTNSAGKVELNSNFSFKLNDRWSTMFLLHGSYLDKKHDENDDGFVDIPLSQQANVINRWRYKDDNLSLQFGFKMLDENRLGGQMNFDKGAKRAIIKPNKDNEVIPYGINIDTRRYEVFMKAGILMPKYENTSMAFLVNLTDHEQDSYYGITDYYGRQKSAYVNYIYQSIFGTNENQKYSAGFTYIYDKYDESLIKTSFGREESSFGGFFQYTGIFGDMWTLMSGLRYDYHSLHGGFITPRVHIKFAPDENTSIRTSIGFGYRSSNVLAENNTYLGSSRDVYVQNKELVNNPEVMQDLNMEKALNYGVNANRKIDIWGRTLNLNAEYYRTNFKQQVVVDLDTEPNKINFYNLDGKSFSDSYQIEAKYELFPKLETTVAYRYNYVRQTNKNGKLIEPALKSRYKGLLNLSYTTNMKIWQFDYTFQFNGDGRMPEGSVVKEFEPFTIMNAQITKWFRHWSIYAGCENIGNFTQDNPILAANKPWSDEFDTSKVWGPIHGRKFYFGFRFSIDRD